MPAARRFPLLLIGAFLALYLVWGSTYLFIRIGVESWPPMLMAGVRFVIAGGLLYGFLRWRGAPAPTWAQWRAAGAIGFLLLSCGNGGVTVAEHAGVASGVAALAVATVLVHLVVRLVVRAPQLAAGVGGDCPGAVGYRPAEPGFQLAGKPDGCGPDHFRGGVVGVRLGVEQELAIAPGADGQRGGNAGGWRGAVAGQRAVWGAYDADADRGRLGCVGLPGVLWLDPGVQRYMYLLKNVRPAAATSYAYVNPAVAVLLGIVFAGEQIGAEECVAMAVIIGAVVLIGLPQWRKAPAPTQPLEGEICK